MEMAGNENVKILYMVNLTIHMFNLGSSYFHVALTTVRHLLNVRLS